MLRLIEKMLKAQHIGYVTLSGDVPVKKRGKLIEEFRKNDQCQVFLSTEAGGTGLNLQFADTVINFELPWNPAKKNQRIGRVHRIGQESNKITAINLVSIGSIEQRIYDGIGLKESLFDAVLNEGSLTDEVDFSKKGRSTFIEQLEKIIQPFDIPQVSEDVETLTTEPASGEEVLATAEEPEELIPAGGESEPAIAESPGTPETPVKEAAAAPAVQTEELETTLNQGLQFLSGLLKMATGKELVTEEQSITVNKETGEVTMKFKLPGF